MKRRLLTNVLFACILTGCTTFNEPGITQGDTQELTKMTRTCSGITSFDSLPDPYALANMQAVYREHGINKTLLPTDLYVRFMPQDSLQMELLEDVYDLDLFDYPLDLDIPNGEEYIDTTIPDGEYGWLYTTVKPNFVFPEGIIYEILRECYIPEDGTVIEIPGTRAGENDIDVERAAYERLGYVIPPLTRASGSCHPEGIVTVFDNSKNATVPVKKSKGKDKSTF